MRRYGTRLYQDEDHIPACYGRSWEPDDEDCEGCQLEHRCKNETIQRSPSYQMPAKRVDAQQGSDATAIDVVGKAPPSPKDKGIVQFSDGIMLMPTEDEGWGTTLGKNVAAGAIAAMGKEVYRFFSRFRFR